MHTPLRFSLAMLCALALGACGGGGGGSASTPVATTPGVSTANNAQVLASTLATVPGSTYPAGSAELGGWNVLQQARVLCGFGALTQNTRLDNAAWNHAQYLTSISSGGVSELTHYETVTTDPYYTGYYPWDRTSAQGYGTQVAEILEATAWNYDISNPPALPSLQLRGEASMRSLLNTVYHLMGAMYHGQDVGFGAALQTYASGTARREEYRFGSLNGYQSAARRITLGAGTVVSYPCQGSSNIPSTFVPANESPNPFPSMTSTSQTVGPPIYFKADAGQTLSINTTSVSNNGVAVPTTVLNASNDPQTPKEIGAHEAFVIPTAALTPNTTYQVSVTGTLNGTYFSRNFSMSTGQ